jgi:DNA-binding NarL/FixJ family response regulator
MRTIGAGMEIGAVARTEFHLRAGPDDRSVLRWQHRAVATTVLIVDDHHGFRAWARSLLESEGYAVIGEASSGASALSSAIALEPDLVLLDVMLPDSSGFEVAERLRGIAAPPLVILVSSHDESDFGRRLDAAAAIGFIPKPELSGARLRDLLGAAS